MDETGILFQEEENNASYLLFSPKRQMRQRLLTQCKSIQLGIHPKTSFFSSFLFIISQVEALLTKTGGAMPSASAPVKQHEAFLEETKTLLHPGNFQVCEGGNARDMAS